MEIEITDARCYNCGRKVTAEAHLAGRIEMKKGETREFVVNSIYTYWGCSRCGCVWAEIGEELYETPSELFEEIEFSDWKVKVKRGENEQERTSEK